MRSKFLRFTAAVVLAMMPLFYAYGGNGTEKASTPDTITLSSKLNSLESSLYGLNYKKVIDKYLPMLDNKFTVTRFGYFVVFSELNEDETYNLIDGELRDVSGAMIDNYISKRPKDVTGIIVYKKDNFYRYKNFLEKKLEIKNVTERNTGYHSQKRALIIMRYIEGKGTILHEATHKFMKADFPDAPIWFDEGLASLHEASNYTGGKLVGGFSLRLLTLKTAMVEGEYKNLRHLMEMERKVFNKENTLLNYAQARYLIMFMQEKGILERYYKLFRGTYHDDNTGITQLEKVYGKPLNKIELDYTVYVYSFKGIYP